MRTTLDAVFYVVRSECQWRMLPCEFPPWSTVHHYFRLWYLDGTWETLNAALRQRCRVRDGAKKLSRRKRHFLVDTLGMMLKAEVHAANLQDRAAVSLVLVLEGATEDFPRLEHLWVDQGYSGTGRKWIEEHLGWSIEVVRHPPEARGEWQPHGDLSTVWFEWVKFPPEPRRYRGALPRRWVAERTIGWLSQIRRLSKDYERLCETSRAIIYAAMSRLMLRRLARV